MFAGFMYPFGEKNALEEPGPDVLPGYLSSHAGNDGEDEWLGWDAWV